MQPLQALLSFSAATIESRTYLAVLSIESAPVWHNSTPYLRQIAMYINSAQALRDIDGTLAVANHEANTRVMLYLVVRVYTSKGLGDDRI